MDLTIPVKRTIPGLGRIEVLVRPENFVRMTYVIFLHSITFSMYNILKSESSLYLYTVVVDGISVEVLAVLQRNKYTFISGNGMIPTDGGRTVFSIT